MKVQMFSVDLPVCEDRQIFNISDVSKIIINFAPRASLKEAYFYTFAARLLHSVLNISH